MKDGATAQQSVPTTCANAQPPLPPRGETDGYYDVDLPTLAPRERIRRSLRQIANTEPTDRAFCAKIDVKPSYYCNWIKAKCGVDIDNLDRISRVYGVSMQEIFDGTACTAPGTYKTQATVGMRTASVKRIDTGKPLCFPKHIIDQAPEKEGLFAYVMPDTSMAHRLPKGAELLLVAQSEVDNLNAPYLCEVDGERLVRKITVYSAGFQLEPTCDDPTIQSDLVVGDRLDSFKIVGKVIWYQLPNLLW